MNTPPKDLAEKTPPADPKPATSQNSPSSQKPSPIRTPATGQTSAQTKDEQIKAIVADNDKRLWYITKFGGEKFPPEALETLVRIRREFQNNPNCQLSNEQEVQYRKATMTASTFLIVGAVRERLIAPPEDRAVRLEAEFYDSILALAVMPMLYALLGALTSAVRTANFAFKAMTLTRIDGISLGARVLLGVVGGATIGIVFSADTLEGTTGLTVLGLAFAAGYAVDLFFNLLDGIKIGLGGSTKPRPVAGEPKASG